MGQVPWCRGEVVGGAGGAGDPLGHGDLSVHGSVHCVKDVEGQSPGTSWQMEVDRMMRMDQNRHRQ